MTADNKRIHLAIATNDVNASIEDYSERLGLPPCSFVAGEYALWRTAQFNISIRQDPNCRPGELRHLGFEDPEAPEFSVSEDVNGIVWERFTAEQQAQEIENAWPGTGYIPEP